MTSAQKGEVVSIVMQEDSADNTHVPVTTVNNCDRNVNIYTQQENISSVSLQPSEQYEEMHSDHTDNVKAKTQIQEDRSGFITVRQPLPIIQL